MRLIQSGSKHLLVTSCWENEGKTTVCINLSVALAEFGFRVLLVDGDLRQRSVTRLLAGSTSGTTTGGVRRLIDELPLVDFLAAEPLEGRNPADVVASAYFGEKLAGHIGEYDVALVDSPPLSACSDALLLGRHLDGAIIVSHRSHFRGIPEGHFSEDLRDSGIRVLGVVLTGVGSDVRGE